MRIQPNIPVNHPPFESNPSFLSLSVSGLVRWWACVVVDDILLMLSRIIRRSFSTSGHLLTWGETTYGWGRPTNSQYWTPGHVQNFDDIISVSTGEYHLGFVTKDHAVYTVGLSQDGRLGQSTSVDTELPRRVSFDAPNIHIKALSLGSRHSLALTADGAVYAWGHSSAVGVSGGKTGSPVRIPQESFGGHSVVSVAAARDFSVAVCDHGHLYAWGKGLEQLPEWSHVSTTPAPVEEVAELLAKRHAKIKKVAAIDRFIMLLLDNGRIYCRGINNGGVFGARTNPLVLSDLQLSSFAKTHDELYKGEKIVDFEVSSNSLIFRTETDQIFYSGMNVKFQPTPFPSQVKGKIFATESSVGVVGQDGKVYFLNEKLVDDSDFICKKNRLFVSEDPNLSSVIDIGGAYHLRYALVQ